MVANVGFPFVQFLSVTGDGSGAIAMNIAHAAPTLFYVEAPAGVTLSIHRLIIHYADTGGPTPTNFGDLAGLTNGIKVELRTNGVVRDSLDGQRIKNNSDWITIAESVIFELQNNFWFYRVESEFQPNYGIALVLSGHNTPPDYFGIVLDDNLSGLLYMKASVRGRIDIPAS